jgi:hypothetical protein
MPEAFDVISLEIKLYCSLVASGCNPSSSPFYLNNLNIEN